MALIGAGNQARWHAAAFAEEFPLEEIRVFSASPERRATTAAALAKELGIAVIAVDRASDALEGADKA
jgi:ornithine cyclodeaminase/alanine dehydrogenase